jgi:hypothetical protein
VVPLFDYLYFELRRVPPPAVHDFIEPFHKCFYREVAHIGTELDSIGEMWGTSPVALLKAAREALEADLSASEGEFKSELAVCENSYNMDATAGEGALALSMQVSYAHRIQVEKIAELKSRLVLAEATAITLDTLKAKTAQLATVEKLLGKRHR